LPKENNKEQKQGITYVEIPGEIAFNKNLNKNDTYVFWMIKTLDSTKNHCWASNDYIAKKLNVSVTTISTSITKLKEQSYIKQISFNGRNRKLAIDNTYHEKYRYLIEEYNSNNKSLKESLKADFKEPYRQTLKTLKIDNNIDNNSKETIINDRNGFADKSKSNIPVKLKEQDLHSLRLIQYWVNFEHTTQHNTNKPYNKSCLQMIKYLSDLQKGSFAINRRFDPDWIKKENIPENWFTKAWTYIELREGLKQASKYALEGYWPNKNKENFKSLSYILYNDFGDKKRSWLFTAMKNPPQTIKELFQKIPLESIVNKFIENPIWPKGYEFDKYRLGKGLVELKEFSDNLIRDRYNRSHEFFGSLSKLLKEYVVWIDEQDWIEIKENIIGTKNKVFGLFIEAQEKELEIKIKSKGWK